MYYKQKPCYIINSIKYGTIKYHKSILTKSETDTELMLSMLLALLVEQNKE